MKLRTRDIVISALFASLWGVLNFSVSPVFFNITRLPILCDILGISSLTLAIWLSKKPGVGSLTGIIATLVTLALRPNAFYFIGFTLASIVFDALVSFTGIERIFVGGMKALIVAYSVVSTAIAGFVIGYFFMSNGNLAFTVSWTFLHAAGGLIGSLIAVLILEALKIRLKK